MSMPAIDADSQVLNEPQISAEMANWDISPVLDGAKVPSTPTCMPTLPKLANPHRAYVVTSCDLGDNCPLYVSVNCL